MNNSIKQELKQHLINHVKDAYHVDETNFEELHHTAFNQDYYIIGYYEASQWLKHHDVDAFEAMAYVMEKEQEHFGESSLHLTDINSERIVNLLVYFAGDDVMPAVELDNITRAELLASIEAV